MGQQKEFTFFKVANSKMRLPLISANWYLEYLVSCLGNSASAQTNECIKGIQESIKRAEDILDCILHSADIELGTLHIEIKQVDFREIIEGIVSDLHVEINKKGITVDKTCIALIPQIFSDPRLVRVICRNVLTNSIQYTPAEGKVKIQILPLRQKSSFMGHEITSDSVACRIVDTGYGIPKADQEQIFSKLFRGSNVSKRKIPGTGMGLYIAKSLLEQLGGMIWFSSPGENMGCTFYIVLPVDMHKHAV